MPPKIVLQTVATLVVAILLGLTALRGAPDTPGEWLAPIGPAVAVASAALWLFDRHAWRWRGIRTLARRPELHGTWHGELASHWVDPKTGQRIAADPDLFLVVRQCYWSISARLLTKESASASQVARLTTEDDDVRSLIYVYANTPRVDVRHRSAPHFGAVVLAAPRNRTDGLEGSYFTDRTTRGELRFRRHYPRLVETHTAGRAMVRGAVDHTPAPMTAPADRRAQA